MRERWDGHGIIVHVTLPAAKNPVRRALYSALRSAGFGSPWPGLWVSPHADRVERTASIIDELGGRESTCVFVGRVAAAGETSLP